MSASKMESLLMSEAYIKTENEMQADILSKEITVKGWKELAEAVREKARRLASVAEAFERYDKNNEPFIGSTLKKGSGVQISVSTHKSNIASFNISYSPRVTT
jgi:hypothetical protein